jgi:hypothetical protein
MCKRAVTLIEVVLACFILLVAIIPIMYNSQQLAIKNIETEKIQMAERILESIQSELMTTKFDIFYEREGVGDAANGSNSSDGPFELTDAYYPSSLEEVLSTQQKYNDFNIVGTWSWGINSDSQIDKTMVQVELLCSFKGSNSRLIERKKAFFDS